MSTVYRAYDVNLERWVAIKLMHRDISSDPDQLERFRREARSVARLNHPHVVTVIDFGEDDGRPYIVLELIEGETLKQRIRRLGRLPVGEAVAYAIEVGRALEAAHACRLVHRDVKPQNVLLDAEGRAKVTDFGIARSLEVHGLTQTGRVLGTTDYVSPEQALGHEVTEQSDVYSLGIVLYEMLVGEPPFRAESQVAVAMKHVQEPMPDVLIARPDVSSALAAVVDHATAKELDNRYASAAEMVHDLEQVLAIEAARAGQTTGEATAVLQTLEGDTSEFAPLRLRRPRRWLLTVIAAAVLIAVAAVYLASRTERGPGEPPPVAVDAGELSPLQLAQGSAHDYDPEGDDEESSEATDFAIDANPTTVWDTETYEAGFAGANKTGVGIYLETAGVAAQQLDVRTSTPGFTAAVYAADDVPDSLAGWTKVSTDVRVRAVERIALDTGSREFGNYLLWISELPEGGRVEIKEMTLLE
ncbi:MAG: serine/threonine protein kinase [Solirubrobacterales bacterium]|nr:serine/threonine protein kinase [Solirubrobacterales bacterium]